MVIKGLTQREVLEKRKKFGFNTVGLKNRISPLKIIIDQLRSPLIYILGFASMLSAFLGEFTDAVFILIVVFVNTLLGFSQEYRAENSLELLKKRVSKTTKVIRNYKKVIIEAIEIVPGDIVVLEPGVNISADGEVIEANELMINEALITGESHPIEKNLTSNNKVFMGTVVLSGLGLMKVLSIGKQTKYGKIADTLSSSVNPMTETKKRLRELGALLTAIITLISFIIIILGIYRNIDLNEILLTAIALGVSTIPEGLVIAYTIVLALGMKRIMDKKAIVKNLPAAETLGNIDILCIDKTGTITLGLMSVESIKVNNTDEAIKTLAICNNDSNFIDAATKEFVKSKRNNGYFEKVNQERDQLFPFSSTRKYTAASDLERIYITGAPEKVFQRCKHVDLSWKNLVEESALKGKKIIALASKVKEESKIDRDDLFDFEFNGLVFVSDPVRKSARNGIETIKNAGIEIKVITGDLLNTALSIMSEVGINLNNNQILSGKELQNIKEEELIQKVLDTKLFYRTTPDQKLKIVKILQNQKFSVGMMGDGVNDSPALKFAEIGISVESATDVSKEASDIILLDSNFQTIVDSIEEGRSIFKNLRKIFMYLFGDSLSEVLLITLSIIFSKPLPLLPLQILWINLIEDGFPSIALGFEKSKKEYLQKKHKPGKKSVLNRRLLSMIIIISLVTDFIYFLIYIDFLETRSQEIAQTVMFSAVSISSLLFLYSAKTIDTNIWKENIFNNKIANYSVFFGLIMTFVAIYSPLNKTLELVPLEIEIVGIVIFITFIDLVIVELIKFIMNRRVA